MCVCVRVCVCVYALLLRKSWGIVEFVGIIMGLEVTTKNDCRDVGRLQVAMHRSRIRYLSKKNSRILTNFAKLKKIRKNSYKNSLNAPVGVAFQWNSLLICIISNKPTTTTEEFDAFHGFMLIKI